MEFHPELLGRPLFGMILLAGTGKSQEVLGNLTVALETKAHVEALNEAPRGPGDDQGGAARLFEVARGEAEAARLLHGHYARGGRESGATSGARRALKSFKELQLKLLIIRKGG